MILAGLWLIIKPREPLAPQRKRVLYTVLFGVILKRFADDNGNVNQFTQYDSMTSVAKKYDGLALDR